MQFREMILERFSPAKPRIDRVAGIVFGVRVVGELSRNKRRYPAAVRTAAHEVYEGCAVNIGHNRDLKAERAPTERFGRLRNIHEVGDATYADLHYKPKHTFAEDFLWACENSPDEYALSHHADVEWNAASDEDGNRVARKIHGVASVDIVLEGGTNASIFESNELGEAMIDAKAIAAEMLDAVTLSSFLSDLFSALPTSLFDSAAKMQALEEVMAGMAEVEPAMPDSVDPAPPAVMESLRRRGGVGKWAAAKLQRYFTTEALEKKRVAAKSLCVAEGLKEEHVSDAFLRSLVMESDHTAQRELIADRRKLTGTGSGNSLPRTGSPGTGSKSVKDLVNEADFS